MIRCVYFDFGGVLTERGKKGFIGETLAGLYGTTPEELHIGDMHSALRGGKDSEQALYDELNQRYGKQVMKEQFIAEAHKDMVPSKVVYDIAARIRGYHIKTGILSNVFSMSAAVLRQEGWYEGFDPIILSCEVGYAKPDPEIYQLAIDQAGVQPGEILFIDDQTKCFPPAQILGMHTIRAESPEQIVTDVTDFLRTANNIDW